MTNMRILTSADAAQFRTLRLQALESEGRFFTANYSEEAARTRAQWKAAAAETTGQAYFGAFEKGQLIAFMGATRWDKDPSGHTVYWRSSFVAPEHRGSGIAAGLNKLREEWSVARGFDRAVFTIHPDNARSIHIHEAQGATRCGVEPLRFADGRTVPAIWFSRQLG